MCSCDGNAPSAYWESRPKANKRHKCCECRGWIEAGETYWRVRGVWDGEPRTFVMCHDFEELIGWAGDDADCFCWTFGNVHTDVLDFTGDSGDKDLIEEADARVKAIRNKRRDKVAA